MLKEEIQVTLNILGLWSPRLLSKTVTILKLLDGWDSWNEFRENLIKYVDFINLSLKSYLNRKNILNKTCVINNVGGDGGLNLRYECNKPSQVRLPS